VFQERGSGSERGQGTGREGRVRKRKRSSLFLLIIRILILLDQSPFLMNLFHFNYFQIAKRKIRASIHEF
jgi:hypothetical protein